MPSPPHILGSGILEISIYAEELFTNNIKNHSTDEKVSHIFVLILCIIIIPTNDRTKIYDTGYTLFDSGA